ncbi:Leucine Rich Repeat [Seminavis robusta]|uniref:Leucine Rich Repeat n=1 Tax=Seminavis robusta TaxID=568900 RepID=A0A9N8E734_9STRA|nr:Leucine Rich Repeat [Seminavis robusta]|eukprot:Sro692_g188080.1 Leucine Rich Repeat (442) ;mRNA; f:27774-29099
MDTTIVKPESIPPQSNQVIQNEIVHTLDEMERQQPEEIVESQKQGTTANPPDTFFSTLRDSIAPLPLTTSSNIQPEPGAFPVTGSFPFSRNPTAASSSRTNDAETVHSASASSISTNDAAVVDLVNAEPINELEQEELPTAEPISQRAKRLWKKKLILSLTGEALVGIVIVVGIIVTFVLVNNNGNGATGTEITHQQQGVIRIPVIPGATQAPTTLMDGILSRLQLPDYTVEALYDAKSPQAKAYAWLLGNSTSLETCSNERLIQRFALATIYYATRGDYWVKHRGWLDWETHECNWQQSQAYLEDSPQLHCDEMGQIKAIALMGNNVVGSIPKEVSLLHNSLKELYVSFNVELKGTLPSEIGMLTRLESLGLQATGLSGKLPTELGLLPVLGDLYLGGQGIEGTVPTQLGQFGSLSHLEVGFMSLTGEFDLNQKNPPSDS